MSDPLLTLVQVDKRLETTGQAGRLVRSKALPAVNISVTGGRPTWRVRESALEEFIRTRSTKPTAPAPTRRRRVMVKQYI